MKIKRMFRNFFRNKKLVIITSIILAILIVVIVTLFLVFGGEKKIVFEKKKEEIKTKEPIKIIDLNSNTRNIAVMINNFPDARKYQSGLQDAYIIYEFIVEGGITRYMAIFKDKNTAKIGTIRSSRHYYLDYAMENDAIYVHFGWSPQAQSDIAQYKINNINGLYDNFYWRDKLPVSSEHTAFTSMEKIMNIANKKNYRTTTELKPLLDYDAEEIDLSKIDGAKKANEILIKYSNSVTDKYEYDENTKEYLRSVNGNPHVDYVTNEQYHFKNIIAYDVDNSSIAGDHKGRQNFDNLGTGEGYYISSGYAIPIKWQKDSRESQTKYTLKNGKELVVNDGNTFIQIFPNDGNITIN